MAKSSNRRRPAKGRILRNNESAEREYLRDIRALVVPMLKEVNRQIKAVYASGDFAMDAPIDEILKILENLVPRFESAFNAAAERVANAGVERADRASKVKLKSTFMQEMGERLTMQSIEGGTRTETILKAQVAEGANLIKSIPAEYLPKVQTQVTLSITSGQGLKDLVPALAKLSDQTLKRTRMIAKDQTRKAFNNLNRARIEDAGIKAFEWIHSGGANEPRPLHRDVLDGNIYRFDDLPIIDEKTGERGIPGQLPNCGCTMRVVFIFDDEENE